MENNVFAHVVAGYPSRKECLAFLKGAAQLGVAALEVQIPFSDPSADGPVIMRANDQALANRTTILDSMAIIKQVHQDYPTLPLYVMSYSNKVYAYGIQKFCILAKQSGAAGLIVPDLPIDSTEYRILRESTKKHGLRLVPVLTPGMAISRHKLYAQEKPNLVYITSTRGITGNVADAQQSLKEFIAEHRKMNQSSIVVGFGIQSALQVRDTLKCSDYVVIGSAITQELGLHGVNGALDLLQELCTITN